SPPLRSSLFPYTTLFRSLSRRAGPDLSDRVRLRRRQPPRRPDLRVVRSADPISLTMATNLDLAHATASASLAPKLTAAEEAAKRSEEHTSELQSPDHLVC